MRESVARSVVLAVVSILASHARSAEPGVDSAELERISKPFQYDYQAGKLNKSVE